MLNTYTLNLACSKAYAQPQFVPCTQPISIVTFVWRYV